MRQTATPTLTLQALQFIRDLNRTTAAQIADQMTGGLAVIEGLDPLMTTDLSRNIDILVWREVCSIRIVTGIKAGIKTGI